MADKTKRELAAEEREKIPVESITKEDIDEKEKKEEKEDDDKESDNDDIKAEDNEEDDSTSNEGDKVDKEKVEKETDEEDEDDDKEEKEDDAEKLKVETKAKRQQDRMQKRIDKAVATAKAAQEEAAELKKQLEANPEKKLTDDEVKRQARALADADILEREFVNDCNKLFNGAVKINKDFKKNIDALTDEKVGGIGPVPAHMIGILSELENGAKVLEHLSKADNVDEAEDIWTLNPSRMAARLAKLSIKLEEEGKPKPKELSKVPPAKKGIGGKQTASIVLRDNMPMDEWVRIRNQEVKERQEAKRAGYR